MADQVEKLLTDLEKGDHQRQLHALLREMAAKLDRQDSLIKGQQVAFSASLTADATVSIGPGIADTILVFKGLQSNFGNAYNPATGFFTAPVRGSYMFHWHIGAHGGSDPTNVWLFKNAEKTFIAYEHNKEGFGAASQTIILALEVGDTVHLRMHASGKVFDNDNNVTTFSGHLLFTT